MNNFFDVDVPAPLSKFQGARIVDPSNEIILNSQDVARILDKKSLRKAEKLLKQIEGVLCNLPPWYKRLWWKLTKYPYELRDVDKFLDIRKTLVAELHECKIQWHNLKAEYQNTPTPELREAGRIVRANHRDVLRELKQIDSILLPLKPLIVRRNILRARIEEHLRGIEDQRKNIELTKQMGREANYFADIIIKTFDQLGFTQTITKGDKVKIKHVKFQRVIATPDTIQFKIAVTRMGLIMGTVNLLPAGVAVYDLIHEKTLLQLASACERPIRCLSKDDEKEKKGKRTGVWFEVDRLGIVDGIPDKITYKTIMGVYPAQHHDKIPLMLGVQKGRRVNIVYLRDNPHYLIAGQTGSGKTVAYHGIICTLISNYSPQEIRFIFIDLKEGVAFRRYTQLPHALGDMIEDPAGVIPLLSKLEGERKRRMLKIREIAETIDEYNTMVSPENYIPRIVVCFDEYGALNGTPQAAAIYALTSQLAKKARAAGIHLIIGAQTPYVADVPQSVKANLTFSLVGKQKTLGASLSSTGDRQAYDLPDIPGRMIAEGRGSNYPVQMPFVEPDDIQRAIEAAMQYEKGADLLADVDTDENLEEFIQESKPKTFTEHDFIAWTLLNNEGVISPRKLFDLLEEPVITQREIVGMAAKLSARPIIEFEGQQYKTVPYRKGFKLVLISSETPISDGQETDEHLQVYEEAIA